MSSRDSDSLSIDLLFKAAAGESTSGRLSAFIYLFILYIPPCLFLPLLRGHKSRERGRRLQGPSHLGHRGGHFGAQSAGRHMTNVFIFATKNTAPIRTWPERRWTSAARLFWYFNKYQTPNKIRHFQFTKCQRRQHYHS